jgi:hypothetical protein
MGRRTRRPRRVRHPRHSWREESIQDVITGLDRRASHFALMNLTGAGADWNDAHYVGSRVDEPTPLASSWKLVVAAVILHARGAEFLDEAETHRDRRGRTITTYPHQRMMARFLSRSDNEMGEELALEAFGSEQAFYEALQRFQRDLGLTSLLPVHPDGIQSSRNPNRRLPFFDATTGFNSDGAGPMASPRDMARIMRFLYQGNHGLPENQHGAFNVPEDQRGAFLRRYANPRGSGVGHTMAGYAFGNPDIEMIGCKSGTNPGMGDITATCLFRNKRTGDIFAGFMHTGSSGHRPGLVRGLQRLALEGFEAIEALGRPVVRGARDLATSILTPDSPRPVLLRGPERVSRRPVSGVSGQDATVSPGESPRPQLLRGPARIRREQPLPTPILLPPQRDDISGHRFATFGRGEHGGPFRDARLLFGAQDEAEHVPAASVTVPSQSRVAVASAAPVRLSPVA